MSHPNDFQTTTDPAPGDGVEGSLRKINKLLKNPPSVSVNTTALETLTGAVTETAPASDTASSGLNGRMQRIAQRITSFIALLPASIGGKTAAGSLSVTLATDHSALPLPTGAATAAKQPAIGTAGTPSADVISVQAAASTIIPAAGQAAIITDTTAVTAALYASGNAIGGKRTLANAVAVSGGSSFLHHIHILDRSNTKPSGNILIFNADPSTATITDKSAFAYSTDDLKQVARIPVAAADYVTIDSKATASLPNLGRLCKAASGTSLYAAFVSDGASVPTFAATTNLQIIYKFIPNTN